jgi:NAD(P)-dependent dehydrogenase (short-subunit alcohol dehydrogenase family)
VNDGWLAGKRALVVGCGSGIGRAVLDAFVSEGAAVGALEADADKCDALRREIGGCEVVHGDATSMAANRAAVDAVVRRFGGLDVLVNCVGVFDFYRPLGELDDDQIADSAAEIFQVNVVSHVLSIKAALPALRTSRGNVVLTVSTSGFYPGRGGVLYVSSKFAVRGLVVALAHELAPDVRVNGVAPGGTLGTDLRGLGSLGQADQRLDDRPERAAEMQARTPLAVALDGADHAGAYVFLASDRARGITGTFVHSDGGFGVR